MHMKKREREVKSDQKNGPQLIAKLLCHSLNNPIRRNVCLPLSLIRMDFCQNIMQACSLSSLCRSACLCLPTCLPIYVSPLSFSHYICVCLCLCLLTFPPLSLILPQFFYPFLSLYIFEAFFVTFPKPLTL